MLPGYNYNHMNYSSAKSLRNKFLDHQEHMWGHGDEGPNLALPPTWRAANGGCRGEGFFQVLFGPSRKGRKGRKRPEKAAFQEGRPELRDAP